MILSYDDAIDYAFTVFYDVWQAGATDVVGFIPGVVWPGLESADAPDAGDYWVSVHESMLTSQQRGLHNAVSRLEEVTGILEFAVHATRKDRASVELGRRLAQIIRNAYKNQRNDAMWFRNAIITTDVRSPVFNIFRVTVDYVYTEQG